MSRRHISRKIMRNVLWSGMFLSMMAPTAPADAALQGASMKTGEPALSDQQLDQLRGGFLTDSGFLVKFSFQNFVKIDGVLQAATVIKIPEIHVPTLKFTDKTSPSVATLTDRDQKPAPQINQAETPVPGQYTPPTTITADAGPQEAGAVPAAPGPTMVSFDQSATGAPADTGTASLPSPVPAEISDIGAGQALADSQPVADAGLSPSSVGQTAVSAPGLPASGGQSVADAHTSPAPVTQTASNASSGGGSQPVVASSDSPPMATAPVARIDPVQEKTAPAPGDPKPETVVSSNQMTTVTQSGSNNHIDPTTLNNLQAVQTFIQNTLNDKHIQHSQILNVEISKYPFQLQQGMKSRINAQLLDLR